MDIKINKITFKVFDYDDGNTILERYFLNFPDTIPSFFRIKDPNFKMKSGVKIKVEDVRKVIAKLNQNDFGIKIDPNLVPYNRESFNENGIVSYWEDDDSSY